MMSLLEGGATRRLWPAVVAASLIALLLAGCAAVEKDRRATSLDSATRAYLAALRWGDVEGLVAFLPPEVRAQQDLAAFKDLRVTRYEVLRPLAMLTETEATQTVAIEYLYEFNQIVRRTTDRQSWRWDDEAKAWWIESGLPDF